MVAVTHVSRSRLDSNLLRRRIRPERDTLPDFANAEVQYAYPDWIKIRDTVDGERALKEEREVYLPSFPAMDKGEYNSYLDRASFYNFTARTIKAIMGRLLTGAPSLEGLNDKLSSELAHISYQAETFETFYKRVAREIVTMGRIGVLIDMPVTATAKPSPYFASYTAENILDWQFDESVLYEVPGEPVRLKLTRVVLREWIAKCDPTKPPSGPSVTTSRKPTDANAYSPFYARYRVLNLNEAGEYTVEVFESENETDAEINDSYSQGVTTPLVRGKAIQYIPFQIFGPSDGGPTIETSPILSICETNLSHYRSYAHLEQGRFYCGFPIYFAEASGAEDTEYELGPNRVWVLEKGARAGLIEFNGQGLKFLENALTQKENHAAALGARMIGVSAQSVSESGDQVRMKEMNEQATLLAIATQLDNGFTNLFKWWVSWHGVDPKPVRVEFQKDFILAEAGAREFRALHSMYKDGVLPIEVLYDYFLKYQIIPESITQDEFIALLESKASFPGQPDADARLEGFSDADAKLEAEQEEKKAAALKEQQQSGAFGSGFQPNMPGQMPQNGGAPKLGNQDAVSKPPQKKG
jgi:hypothetical protein